MPVGIVGELYVGGAGLARGYQARPDTTAAAFVPHPFSQQPGARLYRTGDLVRLRTDGELEFVGRVDHQVKICGFRIELGEIEAVLGQQPGVQEAIVQAREETGEKQLVAYFVPTLEVQVDRQQLRQALLEHLPSYMIPTAFIPLAALPLTPNGKVDHRALSAPQWSNVEHETFFVAPRTPLEEQVGTIWREVLHLEQVGIHDNFFSLGGHSLLATQVLSRLREAFRVEVPLRVLFDDPSIATLAKYLEQARQSIQEEIEVDMLYIPPLSRGESDVDQLLAMLEQLSDEEVLALLASDAQMEGKTKE